MAGSSAPGGLAKKSAKVVGTHLKQFAATGRQQNAVVPT
jgi:hypothetical protein